LLPSGLDNVALANPDGSKVLLVASYGHLHMGSTRSVAVTLKIAPTYLG